MGGKLKDGGDGKGRNGKQPPVETRWKPGVSPNPGGVPKGKRISTWMLEIGAMTADEFAQFEKDADAGKVPVFGVIALARIRDASTVGSKNANGASDIVLDRTEGKVPQDHRVGSLNPHAGHDPEELAKMAARLAAAQKARKGKA